MYGNRLTWTRREALMGFGALAGGLALFEGGFPRLAYAQDQPLKTEKLSENLNVIMGDGGNIALLSGADGLLMVDTGYKKQADSLIKAAKEISPSPAQMVINTHWHGDHAEGNETFGSAGARIVAHANTRKRLSSDQFVEFLNMTFPASPRVALPVLVFENDLTLFWDNEEIHLLHVPPAHTDTDIVVHFRNANVLHAGDLLFNGMYPFIDYSTEGWIGGMVTAADKIIAMTDDKTKIIPGHGPMATRADMKAFRDMLATIQARVEKLMKAGKSADEVVAAKPTADQDAKWGKGFLKPDQFARLTYATLNKRKV